MIGLAAAVALFAASLWMLVDWWCDPRPLPAPRVQADPLRRLKRLLLQAELGWPADRLAGAMLGAAVVVGLLAYQFLGWLVPSLFAAAFCIIEPIGYVVFRRAQRRAERQ